MISNNKNLYISIAGSRKATFWPKTDMLWSDFTERLKTPIRSPETYAEYLAMNKSQQAELKDVGGFVGGTFLHDRRKASYVEGRDLVTLDMDNIPNGGTDDVLKRVGGLLCGAVVYSTRKHSAYAPRLRVVIPLDRTVSADEYEPIARKLAGILGVEFCDPTTFDASRLMYWPSCCSDGEYIYQVYDHPFCSADGILQMYGDWRNIAEWPQVPGAEAIEKHRLARQENPLEKQGIVGAFCRTYTIPEAMAKFIPGIYEETDVPGRYTYTGGSTQGGAVVYDGDLFLYSHHATDPCSGQLVNAFDMVRLHKYGHQDDMAKPDTPTNRLPSFASMLRTAQEDPATKRTHLHDQFGASPDPVAQVEVPEAPEGNDDGWLDLLELDNKGFVKKTINNVTTVLEHDPVLKGKVVVDEFAACGLLMGPVPWDPYAEKRRWTDVDDAGFYRYMESRYGITGRDKLDAGLLIVSNDHKINDVREYLLGLSWDNVKRLDTLFIDYLGAEDNLYTRTVTRKSLAAAVARALEGGVKFDYMTILAGDQGIGKSTLLATLGKEWFSDSLTTFEGKEAAELIQGTWINEIGELTAMTKQETNAVKQFLSKTHDIYRAAYGRRTEKYPRRCVFFGTSNDDEFLKDYTGNRRFWPIDVGIHTPTKSVWEDLPGEVDQIWAEAVMVYRLGEKLYLPKDVEALAKEQQEAHRESASKEGIIREFLDKRIPKNWYSLDLMARRQFLNGNLKIDGSELVPRWKVCSGEIWQECLGSDIKYMKRMDSMEINNIMRNIKGWKKDRSSKRYGMYGTQRGFYRDIF